MDYSVVNSKIFKYTVIASQNINLVLYTLSMYPLSINPYRLNNIDLFSINFYINNSIFYRIKCVPQKQPYFFDKI